jgi:hypothetical protein
LGDRSRKRKKADEGKNELKKGEVEKTGKE